MNHMQPIYKIIPELKKSLSCYNNLVLQAPPGAGKTTVVPLELLGEEWLEGKKIIMLEPRRLAARAAAKYMSKMLGEQVGETVGYRVRMDSKVGPKTRIEIVTEGIFNRILQNNPELENIAIVIFDEFHERSIAADLGLALSLDVQEGLREDLKILVMSATLDGDRVSALMNNAPIITSVGKSFDVERHYIDKAIMSGIEKEVCRCILKALDEQSGSMLVFLPGAGEIERTRKILEDLALAPNVIICPLYGMMQFKDQDIAISPAAAGTRKIVLSTAIAETSLTIEGIKIVIDSGLQRISAYDVGSGMSRLITVPLSKASADQRAGRAGRLEPGICYRLWTAASHSGLKSHTDPEITRADLMALTLDLADWGIAEPEDLKWLDLPDKSSFNKSRDILHSLGALDHNHRITDHGREMAEFAMHPRLAHMVLRADKLGHGLLALSIAALLDGRDILRLKPELRTADLRLRLSALSHVKAGEIKQARQLGCDIHGAKNILKQIKLWQLKFRMSSQAFDVEKAGLCLGFAFPDRIAVARETGGNIYLLSGGRGARLINDDPLGKEKYMTIGHLDKGGRDARIFLAAPVSRAELEDNFSSLIHKTEKIIWDDRSRSVKSLSKVMLDKTVLSSVKLENPDPDAVALAMINGIRKMGLECLPWDNKSILFKRRVLLLSGNGWQEFPDFSDKALLQTLEGWLLPYLGKMINQTALAKLDLYEILKNILSWQQSELLGKMVPTHFKVPSGSNILIDYEGEFPILSVKLQEMFGAVDTPKILMGKLPLTIHLLSPARRPLQITSDLSGFWQNSYPQIKKEMKGRYPKHPWPDNPLKAEATKKLKKKNN